VCRRERRKQLREALRELLSAGDPPETAEQLEAAEIEAAIRAARAAIRNLPAPR
jgi:16S rRNA A1518/A1519 N6-dimethyltransferase RsmA/KsgA/DIM1 with predicted DNA glycosylase/AP lyase activity